MLKKGIDYKEMGLVFGHTLSIEILITIIIAALYEIVLQGI